MWAGSRRKGELNERQARTHPRQERPGKQALGAGNQFVQPQVGAVACAGGDRFLICSDGLVEGLWDRRIDEVARTSPLEARPHPGARPWSTRRSRSSGRDNTTAIVIEILPAASPTPR